MTITLVAQLSWLVGVSGMTGTLQSPYVRGGCSSGYEALTLPAAGALLYTGAHWRGVSLTAGYLTGTKRQRSYEAECVRPPASEQDPAPDGVYEDREFQATHTSIHGWAFHLRYSPDKWPMGVYAGTGFRFGGGELGHNPLVTVGGFVRTPTRLSLLAGGEVTQLRTYYVLRQHVMMDGRIVSTRQAGAGYGWRKFEVIRFGLEYRH